MCFSRLLAFSLIGTGQLLAVTVANAQTRDEKVRQDRAELVEDDTWYYDDFDAGLSAAKEQNKPLMAVLRCIP